MIFLGYYGDKNETSLKIISRLLSICKCACLHLFFGAYSQTKIISSICPYTLYISCLRKITVMPNITLHNGVRKKWKVRRPISCVSPLILRKNCPHYPRKKHKKLLWFPPFSCITKYEADFFIITFSNRTTSPTPPKVSDSHSKPSQPKIHYICQKRERQGVGEKLPKDEIMQLWRGPRQSLGSSTPFPFGDERDG